MTHVFLSYCHNNVSQAKKLRDGAHAGVANFPGVSAIVEGNRESGDFRCLGRFAP
jgi:hypothetical protein